MPTQIPLCLIRTRHRKVSMRKVIATLPSEQTKLLARLLETFITTPLLFFRARKMKFSELISYRKVPIRKLSSRRSTFATSRSLELCSSRHSSLEMEMEPDHSRSDKSIQRHLTKSSME